MKVVIRRLHLFSAGFPSRNQAENRLRTQQHANKAVTQLLTQHAYVIVLALDFSKAFDTVRHSTLLDKLARLDLPDHVYNWLVDFFNGHSHCTRFESKMSSASIIQGSAIGPASYVIHASDLVSKTTGNMLCKYADDTYLIIPASNHHSRITELDHIPVPTTITSVSIELSALNSFSETRRRLPFSPTTPSRYFSRHLH